ncbi:sensor histidine kinase [Pseudarthrobacter sp. J1738]|uniref:sensor histidine kinase n=1 Tax=unclassified Pseudarthrobacter TaxID=2647000 RepID=UPI003D2BBEE0
MKFRVRNVLPALASFSAEGPFNVLVLLVSLLLLAVSSSLNSSLYGLEIVPGLLLGACHSLAAFLTLHRPALGVLLSLVPLYFVPVLAVYDPLLPFPVSVPAMLCQILVVVLAGLKASWPLAAASWLASVAVAATASAGLTAAHPSFDGSKNLVVLASISFGLLIAAIITGRWQDIREQLRVERQVTAEEVARRQIADERSQIARELHDVVAHGMSLVSVQATTAKYRYPGMEPAVAAEFEDIAANSRRAMNEMRTLLGVLRSDREAVSTAPQPGLADLPALMEAATRAGVDVEGPNAEVLAGIDPGPVTGLTAYRIVQEALSNVVRHAPSARATVQVTPDAGWLRITVTNTAGTIAPAGSGLAETSAEAKTVNPGDGHGLRGMSERAQLVRGTLESSATPDGGFRVMAHLPLNANATTTGLTSNFAAEQTQAKAPERDAHDD